jgi:DNA-binding SARP family transcriptional activator/ABC-type branched-subunit amino acid transport system substrate-binding protein/DNA-binding beta-propeller fold protein YncE
VEEGLDFRILGPFEVHDGNGPRALGGTRQRSVLALLLVHAGEVMSADRLIDALWGERAPADATMALQAHVSRLRRGLEPHAVIATRPPGYVVDPGSRLDATRFAALHEAGRDALAAADFAGAEAYLAEALGLWRGRALADLEDEPWAQDASRHLEEARLTALEDHVEAQLALGRADLPALVALVEEHPLRERLRGQLMLALYRGGRQAEALEVFTEGRRRLDEELGLEPGPALRDLQQRILEQDPSLAAPPMPTGVVGWRGSGRRTVAAAAAAAAVAAGVVALVVSGSRDAPAPAAAGRGQLALLDARTGTLTRRIAIGTTPQVVAAGAGAVWVVDADQQTLSSVEPDTGRAATFATGATPTDVAAGPSGVWVQEGVRNDAGQAAGPVPATLTRIDPRSRTARARIALPRGGGLVSRAVDDHIALEADAVWTIGPGGLVARIDPRTERVVARLRGFPARAVAAGDGGVWLLAIDGRIARVDRERNRITGRSRIAASAVDSLAVGAGSAWVSAPADGTVWQVTGERRLAMRPYDVGAGVTDVAVSGGHVVAANPLRGVVARIDTRARRVLAPVRVGSQPRGVAAGPDGVWVSVGGLREELPSTALASGGVRLPDCGRVVGPAGGRLVVVDLPLQGGIRLSAQQIAQAIEYEFHARRFRAGRHSVALQVCDHSVARTGLFDEAKCAGNTRAYGRAQRVVAVLGLINTPCAAASLPVSNRAGLPVISPAVSAPFLTQDDALYPTGRRHFARVYPPDDHQASAMAALARDRGARRVAVLDDGDPEYGGTLARAFASAARAAGMEVAATRHWHPQAAGHRRLAAAVAAQRPDAVYLGGTLDTGGGRVIVALRRALGPDVDLFVPDGFTPTPLLAKQARGAARGVFLAVTGLTPESLPAEGRRFVRAFATTLPGVEIEPTAVYGAAAADVVLDAIARSDGSRASVLAALPDTRVATPVGLAAFNADGDPVRAAVTVLRIEPGRRIGVFEDAVLERLVRAD